MLEELGLYCRRARSHRVEGEAATLVGEGARVRSTHGAGEWRCAGRRGKRVARVRGEQRRGWVGVWDCGTLNTSKGRTAHSN